MKILLASKSPRRRELLEQLNIPFSIAPIGDISEDYPKSLPVEEVAEYIANKKGEVYSKLIQSDELIITADTIVIKGDCIFGKPGSKEEAIRMLQSLSDSVHTVATGVCIISSHKKISFTSRTEVKFCKLTDEEIEYYVREYSPFDKAGAYGIQEWIGCIAIEWINGSYYNVMGLPVNRLYRELKSEFGFKIE